MANGDTFRYSEVIKKGKPQHGKYDSFTRKHPPMPMSKRAKIFCPFDALKGFGEMIAEKERFCETEQEPVGKDLHIQNEISDP